MPLPDEALTVTGGCNCGAIRYRIAIPPVSDRPAHFAVVATEGESQKEASPRLPMVITDHCNDCRSATSSILPAWILTPEDMITLSCLPRPAAGDDDNDDGYSRIHGGALQTRDTAAQLDDARPPFTPAHDVLCGLDEEARLKTWLRVYRSRVAADSPYGANSARSFCGRCGTNIAYIVEPFPVPSPVRMVDVILGTADRECIASSALEPERQLWWECGVPWIQKLVDGKIGPQHPSWNPLEPCKRESH